MNKNNGQVYTDLTNNVSIINFDSDASMHQQEIDRYTTSQTYLPANVPCYKVIK